MPLTPITKRALSATAHKKAGPTRHLSVRGRGPACLRIEQATARHHPCGSQTGWESQRIRAKSPSRLLWSRMNCTSRAKKNRHDGNPGGEAAGRVRRFRARVACRSFRRQTDRDLGRQRAKPIQGNPFKALAMLMKKAARGHLIPRKVERPRTACTREANHRPVSLRQ